MFLSGFICWIVCGPAWLLASDHYVPRAVPPPDRPPARGTAGPWHRRPVAPPARGNARPWHRSPVAPPAPAPAA